MNTRSVSTGPARRFLSMPPAARRVWPCVAALAGAIALAFAPARPAFAQIVFDNGLPAGTFVYTSDPDADQFAAETFTFGQTTTFDAVTWYGVYTGTGIPLLPDIVTLTFHETAGGTPSAAPFARFVTFAENVDFTRTPTSGTLDGSTIYAYRYVLPDGGLTLPTGTYGLSIINDTSAADSGTDWGWAFSDIPGGTSYLRTTPQGSFDSVGGNLAFNLSNGVSAAAVPEPGTLALLPIGALALVGVGRLQRRKAATA